MEGGIINNSNSEKQEENISNEINNLAIIEEEQKDELQFVESFEFENKKYIAQTDFDNTYSIRQTEEAAPYINKLLEILKHFISKDENGESKIKIENPLEYLQKLNEVQLNAEILALIFWEEGETKFTTSTFRKRIDIFRDLPTKKIEEVSVNTGNFLSFIISKSARNVLTSMK